MQQSIYPVPLLFEGYFSLIVLRFGASTGIRRQQEKYQSASPCLFLGRVGRDFRLDFFYRGAVFPGSWLFAKASVSTLDFVGSPSCVSCHVDGKAPAVACSLQTHHSCGALACYSALSSLFLPGTKESPFSVPADNVQHFSALSKW